MGDGCITSRLKQQMPSGDCRGRLEDFALAGCNRGEEIVNQNVGRKVRKNKTNIRAGHSKRGVQIGC